MERSKYNVAKDKEQRTYNDIVFDSKIEMWYYRDVLCPLVENGLVKHYELQKKYELQPKFSYNGKSVRPITYVADFYIEYEDGRIEVIDTKGKPDSVALLKRKLFWYRFPDVTYKWLVYVKKFGGWITYEDAKQLRAKAKRERSK